MRERGLFLDHSEIMKKNNGKELEKLVRLIQEAFKEVPRTEIIPNYKIKNLHGNPAEIDVLVKLKIQGVTITIAIECKDYKNRVSGEKVNAFNSKCLQIPELNKRIMVSSKGFQSGAFDAAKQFGIKLFELSQVSESEILNWIDVKKVKVLSIKLEHSDINIMLRDKKNKDKKPSLVLSLSDYVYFELKPLAPKTFEEIIFPSINTSKQLIYYHSVLNFMKTPNAGLPMQEILPFEIKLDGVYLENNDTEFTVKKIEGKIIATLYSSDKIVPKIRQYQESNSKQTIAEVLSMKIDEESLDIIKTKDKTTFFHTHSDGHIAEMKILTEFHFDKNELTSFNGKSISLEKIKNIYLLDNNFNNPNP